VNIKSLKVHQLCWTNSSGEWVNLKLTLLLLEIIWSLVVIVIFFFLRTKDGGGTSSFFQKGSGTGTSYFLKGTLKTLDSNLVFLIFQTIFLKEEKSTEYSCIIPRLPINAKYFKLLISCHVIYIHLLLPKDIVYCVYFYLPQVTFYTVHQNINCKELRA